MSRTWQKGVPSTSGNSAPCPQKAPEEAENSAKTLVATYCYFNEKVHPKFIPQPARSVAELSGKNRSGTMRDPILEQQKASADSVDSVGIMR
jgi:hypothetical protein